MIFVSVHFDVDNVEAICRIAKLCRDDEDFVCIGIDNITDEDFDMLRELTREEMDLF